MFERVMFFIVLALFILTPVGLVYAANSFDLRQYKLSDASSIKYIPTHQAAVNLDGELRFSSAEEVCDYYFSFLKRTRPEKRQPKAIQRVAPTYCDISLFLDSSLSEQTNYDIFPFRVTNGGLICDPESPPTYIDFFVIGHAPPPIKICSDNCEHAYKPRGTSSPPVSRHNTGSPTIYPPDGKYSQMIMSDASKTGKACELTFKDTPNNPPEDNDCTAEQKSANGGQCPKPDADGNKCNESEKAGNGGKCQTPDPDGTKCPDASKAANGGKCPAGSGDGNGGDGGGCSDEVKAANGGKCPAGGGGTCTSNPINQKVCDFIDSFSKPVPEATDGKVEVKSQTTGDVGLTPQQFDTNRVQFGAYCPPPSVRSMSFMRESVSIEISYQPLCDFLSFIKYIIIAAASFAAAYILSGVRS